jgi:hypothetical protein
MIRVGVAAESACLLPFVRLVKCGCWRPARVKQTPTMEEEVEVVAGAVDVALLRAARDRCGTMARVRASPTPTMAAEAEAAALYSLATVTKCGIRDLARASWIPTREEAEREKRAL